MIQHISAVTFAVRAMPEALTFYSTLGFTLIFGGPQSSCSTLQAGEAFVNLTVTPTYTPTWWGRTIFRVEDVDALYQRVCAQGLTPVLSQIFVWRRLGVSYPCLWGDYAARE